MLKWGRPIMSKMSVMLALPIIQAVVDRDCSTDSLFKHQLIREDWMINPDSRMDPHLYDRLMEEAADLCKDPCFGLRLGTGITLDSIGLIGYILLNSGTLLQAFKNYQRYNVLLCSGVTYELEAGRGEAVFSFRVTDTTRNPSYHVMDSILSSTFKIFQKLTGESLKPKRVSLTRDEPVDREPYHRLFGTNFAFNQKENELIFDLAVLDLSVVYRNQELLRLMETHAAQMIRSLNLEQTFSEVVSHAIIKKFDGTIPRIQEICKSLGVSVRSLQLQLKKENTTFKDLLAVIRKNMAEGYLKNPSFSIRDITYALGFSEPVSFQIAFKKWTGQTPGQYRKQFIKAE